MELNEKYQDYENTLKSLKAQSVQAEKNAIVAETNLKTLEERRKAIIDECEKFAGMTMDKIPAVLEQKKTELDEIMTKLSSIDLEGEITKDTLAEIEGIMQEYHITSSEG